MPFARKRSGVGPAVRAIASQVHPVFMLPPIATAWFGALLAPTRSVFLIGLHTIAIFTAVYTAHVKDGLVDFFDRGEDADHPLTYRGCRYCLMVAGLLHLVCVGGLVVAVDLLAGIVTGLTGLIGFLHAPWLDSHPVGATMGYPTGVALSILGGFYVQAQTFGPTPVAVALVLLVLLGGIKIIDDEQDWAADRSINKPTVPVVLGVSRARRLAYSGMLVGLGITAGFVGVGIFPPGALLASVLFGGLMGITVRQAATEATALLVRASYVFLATLLAAVWYKPLSGA